METLINEINKIQIIYDSSEWKQILYLVDLGKIAAHYGDPSLIMSFCHEFYVFGINLRNCDEIKELLEIYNSGMSLEFSEYYFTIAYRALIAIKQKFVSVI